MPIQSFVIFFSRILPILPIVMKHNTTPICLVSFKWEWFDYRFVMMVGMMVQRSVFANLKSLNKARYFLCACKYEIFCQIQILFPLSHRVFNTSLHSRNISRREKAYSTSKKSADKKCFRFCCCYSGGEIWLRFSF